MAADPAGNFVVVAFADYWGSKFGGINSFNSDLLPALGLAGHPTVRVICVVLDAEEADIKKALHSHVEVVVLNRPNDRNFGAALFSEVATALAAIGFVPNDNTVWLGHDRITGEIAIEAKSKTKGRVALVHHMSYAHYEAYAAGAEVAAEKEAEQKALFQKVDIPLAVGPVLRGALADMLHVGVDRIGMLIPGLAEITALPAPITFTAFLSGRISEDTHRIKAAQLGVAGFAEATARANENSALPDALKSSNSPCLKVWGLSPKKLAAVLDTNPEEELKVFAETYAHRVLNIRALPFSTNRDKIYEDLSASSVALSQSTRESSGLE